MNILFLPFMAALKSWGQPMIISQCLSISGRFELAGIPLSFELLRQECGKFSSRTPKPPKPTLAPSH